MRILPLLFCFLFFYFVLGRRQGKRHTADEDETILDDDKAARLAALLSKQFGAKQLGNDNDIVNKKRNKISTKNNNYEDEEVENNEPRHDIRSKSQQNHNKDDFFKTPTKYKGSITNNKAKNLLVENLPVNSILSNHYYYSNSTKKTFQKETLVYVTPWNRNGYNLVAAVAPKITWLVPVWLQIRRSKDGKLFVDGKHDIDSQWLLEVRENSEICSKDSLSKVIVDLDGEQQQQEQDDEEEMNCISNLKVLPRVVFETNLQDTKEIKEVTKLLIQLKKYSNFDGFTLELPLGNEWHTSVEIPRLLKKQDKKCLVIVVLPAVIVRREDSSVLTSLLQLGSHVDRFSVMTYDVNKMKSLPNAPLSWVRDVISSLSPEVDSPLGGKASLRSKLLLGIPLYGWREQEALTGQDMIKWLVTSDVTPLWDNTPKEHRFEEITTGKVCYYPTPLFLQHRLRLAIELNIAGVALWELGQAWPIMLDLL